MRSEDRQTFLEKTRITHRPPRGVILGTWCPTGIASNCFFSIDYGGSRPRYRSAFSKETVIFWGLVFPLNNGEGILDATGFRQPPVPLVW